MITRNLHQPTHGPGMPTNVANAHGMMVYGPYLNTPTTGLALPPESIQYDPSNPPSDPYEQHYVSGVVPGTPVADRSLYFATSAYPYGGNEPMPGSGLPVGTRPAV